MKRIRSFSVTGHPVLGDLRLDFGDRRGEAASTVILAGENGVGKSTVMGVLYDLLSGSIVIASYSAVLEFEGDDGRFVLMYQPKEISGKPHLSVTDGRDGAEVLPFTDEYKVRYGFGAIYSDVDINFQAKEISSVTSQVLDGEFGSKRSSVDLPTQINQLIVDVQALDAADVAHAVKAHPDVPYSDLYVEERMPRFTSAFSRMFDDLSYDRVENRGNHKEIVFRKNGTDVPISDLSSGEKQVVYRGCFLLRDSGAMDGAFVFIDEPEISLHPRWQEKVMDYYKAMFTDSHGVQTSQIFCVTHSPFVIHSPTRRNDKVIVLRRGTDGAVGVEDKPEYYRCGSVEAVEDAFCLRDFISDTPIAYLEGKTDRAYFERAAEVFGFGEGFRFRRIGYVDKSGQERCTGSGSLEKAARAVESLGIPTRCAFVFDSDTHHKESIHGNILEVTLESFDNAKGIEKGIENALVFDGIDIERFLSYVEEPNGYGGKRTNQELCKAKLCEEICAMDDESLRTVFRNLKPVIARISGFFERGV